jgi:glutamate synthase domain-containing protein 3
VAKRILGDWGSSRGAFKKVMPEAFKLVLAERAEQTATAGD